MSVYIIAQVTIHDRERYDRYEAGFLEIFSKYAGELLAVDEAPETLEGKWPCTRTVLLRFPDKDEARRWYGSPEYQELAQHRYAAADANIVVAQGLA